MDMEAIEMCRDNNIVLASNPPKSRYICNKCGFVDSKYI